MASERLAGPEVCIVSQELWAVSKLSKDPVCCGVSPSRPAGLVAGGVGSGRKPLGLTCHPGAGSTGCRR